MNISSSLERGFISLQTQTVFCNLPFMICVYSDVAAQFMYKRVLYILIYVYICSHSVGIILLLYSWFNLYSMCAHKRPHQRKDDVDDVDDDGGGGGGGAVMMMLMMLPRICAFLLVGFNFFTRL